MLADFLTSRRAAGRSPKTIQWYVDQIASFTTWLTTAHPGARLEAATAGQIEQYLACEQARVQAGHLSAATVQARHRALRALYTWATQRGFMAANPVAAIAAPKAPRKSPKRTNVQEAEQLLASITGAVWLDYRDRCFVRLLFWSGIRIGELAHLQLPHIDAQRHRITVSGKTGERTIPCDPALTPDLLSYLYSRPHDPAGALWLASDGYQGTTGAITAEGIRQALRRRCLAAGLRPLNPHAFRHGFAMAMLNEGQAQMSAISKMLGHSSEAITRQFYAEWLDQGLGVAYNAAYARIQAQHREENA